MAEEKSTGKFVGELGQANLQRDIQPPLANMPELGWVLATSFRDKGYRAKPGAPQRHGVTNDSAPYRPPASSMPDNVRSTRVAEKCGFTESRRAGYKGQPAIVFTR